VFFILARLVEHVPILLKIQNGILEMGCKIGAVRKLYFACGVLFANGLICSLT
jgi:hypothetical protein